MALQRFNTYGRLGMITTPTLVITGADDVLVPPANSLLATRITGLLGILTNTDGFFWEVPYRGRPAAQVLPRHLTLTPAI